MEACQQEANPNKKIKNNQGHTSRFFVRAIFAVIAIGVRIARSHMVLTNYENSQARQSYIVLSCAVRIQQGKFAYTDIGAVLPMGRIN
jgi:hypothetical protein